MTKVKKQYTNIVDMMQDIHPDSEFNEELSSLIESRSFIKQLIALRAAKNISQGAVAKLMGCKQSKLSKLENAPDDTAKLGDLKRYAKSVDHELIITLAPNNIPAVDKIKSHVFAIKSHMDGLVNLANSTSDESDESIVDGIAEFFFEVMLNTNLITLQMARSLPCRDDGTAYFDQLLQDAVNKFSATNDKTEKQECVL